jgi:hypothetical protein
MRGIRRMANPGKKLWIVIGCILLVVVGVFCYSHYVHTAEEETGIALPGIVKEGEERTLTIFAGYENGSGAPSVEITLTEEETGTSRTQVSDGNGVASFVVIAGHNYMITASFKDSAQSLTANISPTDMVAVYISDNRVDSIVCYETGTL